MEINRKIYTDIEQGSEEWHTLRIGKITCSNLGKLFTGGKGLTRLAYLQEITYQRLTGESVTGFKSISMQYGNDTESSGRFDYMLNSGTKVEEVPFCDYNSFFVGSPDGLIGSDGILEIKCLDYKNMFEIYQNPDYEIDKNYYYQIQGLMLVLDRKFTDFYIYHPKLGHWLKRYERDSETCNKILIEVEKANNEINEIVNKIKEKTMDGHISIPARRLKTICYVSDGGNHRKRAEKEERERRLENYACRVANNRCIFSDEKVPPGAFNLRSD